MLCEAVARTLFRVGGGVGRPRHCLIFNVYEYRIPFSKEQYHTVAVLWGARKARRISNAPKVKVYTHFAVPFPPFYFL